MINPGEEEGNANNVNESVTALEAAVCALVSTRKEWQQVVDQRKRMRTSICAAVEESLRKMDERIEALEAQRVEIEKELNASRQRRQKKVEYIQTVDASIISALRERWVKEVDSLLDSFKEFLLQNPPSEISEIAGCSPPPEQPQQQQQPIEQHQRVTVTVKPASPTSTLRHRRGCLQKKGQEEEEKKLSCPLRPPWMDEGIPHLRMGKSQESSEKELGSYVPWWQCLTSFFTDASLVTSEVLSMEEFLV